MAIFDVFSKRDKALPDVFVYDGIPRKVRNQILHLWEKSVIQLLRRDPFGQILGSPFFDKAHYIVCSEHGLMNLTSDNDRWLQVINAMLGSDDVCLVLDIIETVTRLYFNRNHFSDRYQTFDDEIEDYVESLNYRLRENGIGYVFDLDAKRLIRLDNTVTHSEIVKPALSLLAATAYSAANQEFLEALDDYKKGDYDDCLVKCCASFESVLKLVHAKKKWSYKQNDTASTLIKSFVINANIETFFTDPFTIIATLRNRISTAHGKGAHVSRVDEHVARYAINATASAILFVVESAK